jgi:class 3 adenylate cyclase
MAFFGAPVENPHHARDCVRAVIDAQRAVLALNRRREEENQYRLEENFRRIERGEPPLLMLDILTLGSGINTGFMTVGTVGSAQHIMNYTVFGREVNLASRLEGASGRARILIGEETYRDLLKDDPVIAATCRAQPLLTLKGFTDPVQCYEVPWRPADVTVEEAQQTSTMIATRSDTPKTCV